MFKPMLAATLKTPGALSYPMIASPKLDGIRVLLDPSLGAVTRSIKPVPNLHVRTVLSDPRLANLDGEVIVGNKTSGDVFNATQSGVMSSSGAPDFTYVVFDSFKNPTAPYSERIEDARRTVEAYKYAGGTANVVMIVNKDVFSHDDILDYEFVMLNEGYEGIMLRTPYGPYKFGRSTEREGTLIKVKQMADAEAEIIGVEFLQHNMNTATTNALGRTERSSHKAGKVADTGQVGALVVRAINGDFEGVEFKIGTGFTQEQREDLAYQSGLLIGRRVTFVYQQEGSKDAPRFPRFKGFRSIFDS